MTGLDRHFACTQCGACCNRAPELELGEAEHYADTFVLQLLMRIYSLPRVLVDYQTDLPHELASAEYYETKRLLSQFAATSWPIKARREGQTIDYVQYLSLSVLPLDLGAGTCPALNGARCSIYERRPLSCRSVPLHYSRPEAAAARALDAFTDTPGFLCATDTKAALIIANGKIVDRAIVDARAAATAQVTGDGAWKMALVKAMKAGPFGLPSPRTVEANAAQGALTASMQGAWRVAEAAGKIKPGATNRLLTAQVKLIEQELERPGLNAQSGTCLADLHLEYTGALTH